jgi:geranylgeranyl diphosphate synthase type I
MTDHRALVRDYLRTLELPFESVAGTIVRERLAAGAEEDLLRSSLVLWACAACGGDLSDALPVAAAFHLFDRFMHLHDELVEESDAEQWDLGQRLNAGDALYALAFHALAEGPVHPERRLAAAHLVARAVLEAIEGRNVDLGRAPNDGLMPHVRSLRRRIAALTGAALGAGATIAGASENAVRGFVRAGHLLAVAATVDDPRLAKRVGEKAVSAIRSCVNDPRRCQEFEELLRA